MGCDQPSVGPDAINFASKPEEQAVHDNDGEEEHLIFEDFVIYNSVTAMIDGGWTEDSRAGRKTKIFQVYSKPSYSPSRGGGGTNSSCVKFASGPKSNDAILLRYAIASDTPPVRTCAHLNEHTCAELLSHAHAKADNRQPHQLHRSNSDNVLLGSHPCSAQANRPISCLCPISWCPRLQGIYSLIEFADCRFAHLWMYI